MDFSDLLGKLGCLNETNADTEFSISQVLSLPLEFLFSFVRNRREAELLLKVSKSAASLDLLTQNYEMIACRAQVLQEAWQGLWLAQEPYIVPAIPLIGSEMSGVNNGRSMLLTKMDNEINSLQELGKQLCHFVDVNYSLVEELRMEGIERLAVNKLLVVEVEKELARRITHICNNKSVRDLSSMRQFLCHLRKPASTGMAGAVDENRDHGDSTTNGSCSTEKITTDGSSEAQHRSLEIVSEDRDAISPDSQSFASKCVATPGDNMHPPSSTSHIGVGSTKMLDSRQFPADLIATSSKDAPSGTRALVGAVDMPDVRNHSSSASEERLPKVLLAGKGYDEHPQVPVCDNIQNQEQVCEKGLEKQFDKSSSKLLAADMGKQVNDRRNKVLHNEFCKGSPITRQEPQKVELTEEHAQVELRGCSDSGLLASNRPDNAAAETSTGQGHCKPLELGQLNKIYSYDLQSTQPDFKNFSKKRQFETASSIGVTSREDLELPAKRVMVPTSFEGMKATTHASVDLFSNKRRFLYLKEGSSHSLFHSGSDEGGAEGVYTPTEKSFVLCSCGHEATNRVSPIDSQASTRCKDCGCFLSQAFIAQQARIEQGQLNESPIPGTQ